MQNVGELSGLLQYELWPLLWATLLLALAIVIVAMILWATRQKPAHMITTLPTIVPIPVDIQAVQAKYLQLIESVQTDFDARRLSARIAHQTLSTLLRQFAAEAAGIAAPVMTLSDLKRSSKTAQLAPVIESYYRPEFAAVETGSVAESVAAAREVVQSWH